jgi:hypothetical protein
MRLLALCIFLICFTAQMAWAQSSSIIPVKPDERYVFGQIYADFRHNFNKDVKPVSAFRFNQGIIGYYHEIAEKVSGKIMLDVTRTTHFYSITDSAGNPLNYDYFEGSKYTAYLKMAQIKWDVNDFFTLRFGQLLNTQYLTFQDQFWGFRYVDVTMQEKFRLGMPADFGAQLDFKIGENLLYQVSVVNGEGPFRHQDNEGKFLYSNNIQFSPEEGLTFKLYADYAPDALLSTSSADKSVISFFGGIQKPNYRVGGEYARVNNYGFEKDKNVNAISLMLSFRLIEKSRFLARWDYLEIESPNDETTSNYLITGIEYEPVEKFTMSVNYRYFSPDDLPMIFGSFGLKF